MPKFIFSPSSTMQEVESSFPYARPLLHSKFHVGGCANCGYDLQESIADLAKKHSKDLQAIIDALNQGFSDMNKSELSIEEFIQIKDRNAKILILDVREEWEFETSHIPNSILLTEANFSLVLESAKQVELVVVVCHHGMRSLNACMYLRDNGFKNARSLKGGLDAYTLTCDSSVPRY